MPPRLSFLALTVFLTATILLLFRPFFTQSSLYHNIFGHGRSLQSWLNEEEARYAAALQDRQQLITKVGPAAVDVES